MAFLWLRRLLKKRSRPVSRSGRKKSWQGRFVPCLEALGERVLPAISVSFAAGTLRVSGDEQDNTIVVSRDAAGSILINNGAVPLQGVTVANTHLILLNGGAGNDHLSLDDANGPLPLARLDGGAGNDVLTGGSEADVLDGGPGDDMLFGGAGNDTFEWSPGDGSDVVEGQGGRDTLVFSGSNDAEKFDISANGSRVRLTRDVGGVTMDLNGIEEIDLNANGGADTITVNDTSGTDLSAVNLDLSDSAGRGDGQADAVIVNGTNGDDNVQILPIRNGTHIAVLGLSPPVNIAGADGTSDHLTVNTLGGNDVVDSSGLPANLIGLTVNLGDGQDLAATTTTLRTSAATAASGQAVLLTAGVSSQAGTPTGTVTFLDGNAVLGSAPVSATGQATLTVSLPVGRHTLTAVYGGDATFAGSASASLTETVLDTPSPPAAPPLHKPFALSLLDQLLGGVESVNANGTATVTDNFFGFPLVAMYDAAGNLVSVTLFGFNITFLFVL
jgi:hypothetical protein